jgi:hypothetical protein
MAGTRRRNPFIQERDERAHDLIEHYLDTCPRIQGSKPAVSHNDVAYDSRATSVVRLRHAA